MILNVTMLTGRILFNKYKNDWLNIVNLEHSRNSTGDNKYLQVI